MSTITRIVRLSFEESKIDNFLHIFETSKSKISNFPGCRKLDLMRDYNDLNVYYTVSQWETNDDLNKYRNSELFKITWAKTKLLFNDKPYAFSMIDFIL